MATTSGINIAFLTSGKQFSIETKTDPTSTPKAKLTSNARLEEFYAKTLEAFLNSKKMSSPPSSSKTTPVVVGINVDALRSGTQFVPTQAQSPQSQPSSLKSARLEAFHDNMLRAVANKPSSSSSSGTAVVIGINVDALRSGRQFVTPPESKFTPTPSSSKTTRYARLEHFYDASIDVHSKYNNVPSVVGINVDALRSGRQFVTTPESMFTPSPSSSKTTRHARLERFYNTTLTANKVPVTTTTEDDIENALPRPIPRPINLDFIRSGFEFTTTNAASPEARRYEGFNTIGRHARLENFHDNMLKAFLLKPTKTKLISVLTKSPPTGINLDFIRSGQEFSKPNASSLEAQRWAGFYPWMQWVEMGGNPKGNCVSRDGKQVRLQKFHDRTLALHSQSCPTK